MGAGAVAAASPAGVSGTSVSPVCRPVRLHSVSPCRSRISSPMAPSSPPWPGTGRAACSGAGQDLVCRLLLEKKKIEMGPEPAVLGHHGPSVGPPGEFDRAQGLAGLDGDGHSRLHVH